MPIWKRRLYFLLLLVIFLIAFPLILLYTSGYRLGEGFNLVKTGGIYVSVPLSGAQIYINNKLEQTTNLIQKSLFLQNLSPGTYFVFVYKEGYWPWSKELRVTEQIVADTNSFLIAREPKIVEIPKDDQNYKNVSALFSKTPLTEDAQLSTKSASATSTVIFDNVKLTRKGQTIYAKWLGNPDRSPSYFCDDYKKNCLEEILVFTSQTPIKTFDFYPGRNDLVILARKNGIYAVETDKRRIQNFALVYGGGDPDFRVGDDNNIYIKDNLSLYSLSP